MKDIFAAIAILFLGLSPYQAESEVLAYKLTMRLRVPRVYNNTQSLGYRKMQYQTIVGYVIVDKDVTKAEEYTGEPEMSVFRVYNKTHKVNNANVTYGDADATDVMWRYIGSNKTGVFKNTNIKFSLDLNPSYNIGADEPDNALIVTLSGYGTSEKYIKGSVSGQIGCGCMAYGHVSPTRTVEGNVSDITPLYGTFTMRKTDLISCNLNIR